MKAEHIADLDVYRLHLELGLEDPISFYSRQAAEYGDRQAGHTTRILLKAMAEIIYGNREGWPLIVCGNMQNVNAVRKEYMKLFAEATSRGVVTPGAGFVSPEFQRDFDVASIAYRGNSISIVLFDNHPEVISESR